MSELPERTVRTGKLGLALIPLMVLLGCEREYPTTLDNQTGREIVADIVFGSPQRTSGGLLGHESFYEHSSYSLGRDMTLNIPERQDQISSIVVKYEGIRCELNRSGVERASRIVEWKHRVVRLELCR